MAVVLTQRFTSPRHISRHRSVSHLPSAQRFTSPRHISRHRSLSHEPSERHLWRRSNAGTETTRYCMSPKSNNLPQNDGTAIKFVVGQRVQAQYRVGSTWRSAIVSSVQPSSLGLQFDGWKDVNYIPIERARHVRDEDNVTDNTRKPTLQAFVSRGSAVLSNSPKSRRNQKKPTSKSTRKPTTSRPPRTPTTTRPTRTPTTSKPTVNSEAIKQLQVLKQTAVINEDFLAAANLKMQIEKVTVLEREKVAAVNKEDFLLAMEIKKKIDKLVKPIHEQPTQCK